MNINSDVLIIGSGAAGLCAALHLADHCQVAVVCKGGLMEGSSRYAQGGIAAVQSADDSLESHVQDTLIAGAGLCDRVAVDFVVNNAKAAIQWLVDQGVDFTKDPTAPKSWPFHLVREGGHSHRRIIHTNDATGYSVQSTLTRLVREHPNIRIYEHHTAVDLIVKGQRCVGAYIFSEQDKSVHTFAAKAVLLATGGASRVYLYSTNPVVSSGDGIAIAYRAGCRIANMEFNQFHPTCLYHPQAGSFLITEAMRGEGAHLLLPDGSRFMPRFDERAELAPRDIVARAIDHEMKRLGLDCVYLDISHREPAFIKSHFPTIYEKCLTFGIDITKDRIPVVPAAHYTCGGVMINHQGQTDLPGLYAAGEVAYTGLHGANRMASNSLLECLVYATAASQHIIEHYGQLPEVQRLPAWDESQVTDSEDEIVITQNWDELRRTMWNYVGIVRSDKRLQRAANRIALLTREIEEYYSAFKVTRDLLELRNLITIADLIVRSAQSRKESRGLHYTVDYPEIDERFLRPTIVQQRF
jgi:L-aspartate oxidase